MDVHDWLLDSDPAIRWQVMQDLIGEAPETVAIERARVATEGWGAQLLALQGEDGQWDGGTYRPGWVDDDKPFFDAWTGTHYSLQLLRDLGVDPGSPEAERAVTLVRDKVRWEFDDSPYFHGETEPCINGMALSVGAYFGQDVGPIVEDYWPINWVMVAGTARPSYGSSVSSFHTTICVLEGLHAHESLRPSIRRARRGPRSWRGLPPGTGALPVEIVTPTCRSPIHDDLVPGLLVLRHPPRSRLLPACRCLRRSLRRGRGDARVEKGLRWALVAGEPSSGADPFPRGWSGGLTESLEHPEVVASAGVGGRRDDSLWRGPKRREVA